ncbi:MAG TPA: hypothetical protein VMH27_00075 [Puia sp.]|nr:hypothetical protein [Puia sp.]
MPRRILTFLAGFIFLCSLAFPAFQVGTDSLLGLAVLIYGWVTLGTWVGWSYVANPLFIVTLLLFFRRNRISRRIALFTAAAAFLLALVFLLVNEIPGKETDFLVGKVSRQTGYWVWLSSMAALLVAAVLNDRERSPG